MQRAGNQRPISIRATSTSPLAPGAKAPPPGKMMGGPGAISPGGSSYWVASFTPGNYLMLCFVPDSAETPHAMKGMVKEFTIN